MNPALKTFKGNLIIDRVAIPIFVDAKKSNPIPVFYRYDNTEVVNINDKAILVIEIESNHLIAFHGRIKGHHASGHGVTFERFCKPSFIARVIHLFNRVF